MEALLNFLWLVIALCAFVRWGRQTVRPARKAHPLSRTFAPLVALACALAVLFPAISATDDLHPALFLAEDVSTSRRNIAPSGGCHGHSNYGVMASPPALASTSFLPVNYRDVLEILHFTEAVHPVRALPRAALQRAPPLS
ncbi:MAG: hypothetical protein EPN47_16910 [Acidobacteria bacterium]|nr:MAG: hypothetical protein EPN47_16910 [Acidobacteriota bacterium]